MLVDRCSGSVDSSPILSRPKSQIVRFCRAVTASWPCVVGTATPEQVAVEADPSGPVQFLATLSPPTSHITPCKHIRTEGFSRKQTRQQCLCACGVIFQSVRGTLLKEDPGVQGKEQTNAPLCEKT